MLDAHLLLDVEREIGDGSQVPSRGSGRLPTAM
jgi:hypothetical protein